jgi:hypothetical protein
MLSGDREERVTAGLQPRYMAARMTLESQPWWYGSVAAPGLDASVNSPERLLFGVSRNLSALFIAKPIGITTPIAADFRPDSKSITDTLHL